jgi:hypothetical protein
MADYEVNDLTLKATVDSTDEIELQETGGGSSRKTTIAGLRITQSQVTDLAPSYGALYEDNDSGSAISVTTGGTYYGWTTATSGELAGSGYVTADTADVTADHLTIGASGAGIYVCHLTASFTGSTSETFKGYLFNSGVITHIGWERAFPATSSTGSAGASGLLDLSASDEISFRVTSAGSSKSLTVYRCQLSIFRIE